MCNIQTLEGAPQGDGGGVPIPEGVQRMTGCHLGGKVGINHRLEWFWRSWMAKKNTPKVLQWPCLEKEIPETEI